MSDFSQDAFPPTPDETRRWVSSLALNQIVSTADLRRHREWLEEELERRGLELVQLRGTDKHVVFRSLESTAGVSAWQVKAWELKSPGVFALIERKAGRDDDDEHADVFAFRVASRDWAPVDGEAPTLEEAQRRCNLVVKAFDAVRRALGGATDG